jgi:hypothetical protein
MPSREKATLVTPTLSEADAVTAIVLETVALDAGEVRDMVGGVVSRDDPATETCVLPFTPFRVAVIVEAPLPTAVRTGYIPVVPPQPYED